MPQVQIGTLSLQLNRKAIKNLHISVLPPDGRIRVSAPEHMTDTAIRMAVVSRIPWIKRQQRDFEAQPRQSDREMLSGEAHYLWGRAYRLDISTTSAKPSIKLKAGRIGMMVPEQCPPEKRAELLQAWYRQLLKSRIQPLLEKWQVVLGVEASFVGIKRMKTKWGSCNTQTSRIWLNLELVKKLPECLEYIVVHELVHLLERNHNERFKAHMDRFLPNWRERRNVLNKMPLAFNHWLY